MELELVQEVMEVQAKYSWDDLKTMLAFLSHVSEVVVVVVVVDWNRHSFFQSCSS